MRRIIRSLLAVLAWIPAMALATAQIPDQIVLDGEASGLLSEPLTQVLRTSAEGARLKLDLPMGTCSANWRGYRAFWRIADDRLLLEKVVTDACAKKPPEVRIETLFGGRHAPVQADWFTGVLIVTRGKLKQYGHLGLLSTWERYVVLVVEKGRVVSRTDLDEPPQ